MRIGRFSASTLAVLALCLGAARVSQASAIAFPSGATTGTQAKTYVNNNTILAGSVTEGTTATSTSITAGANNATSSVDLVTGELKVFGTSTAGFQSIATGWEFLTFNGNGSIGFSFDLDGSLRNFNNAGAVGVNLSAFLFDVTSWTSYFGTDFNGNTFLAKNGSGSPFADLVGSFGNYFDGTGVRGIGANAANCTAYFSDCVVDGVGTSISADLTLANSYAVQAGKVYLLQLALATETVNQIAVGPSQIGDFAHTATFAFTNLDGLTVESSSGQFLSQAAAPAPVPEPASMLLLGSGLAAAGIRRWKKRAL